MTFYHFTARRFVDSIKRMGLTRGKLLKNYSPIEITDGYQWITTNSDWNQEWAVGTGMLPYKRNEVRLTIKIPKTSLSDCIPWSRLRFLIPNTADILGSRGDPENWWVFDGRIKPSWIVKFDEVKND